jgi:signal peptidase II
VNKLFLAPRLIKMKKTLRNLLILIILVTNVGCDQISKSIIRQKVDFKENISVFDDFLTLTKVENTGAFLSLGHDLPRMAYIILMIIIPLIVLGYALYFLMTSNLYSKLFILGLCLVVGGGFGNIIDRILYGSVTDFLHFNFVVFQTGIVNMADISVTGGFFILLYELYINRLRLNPKISE